MSRPLSVANFSVVACALVSVGCATVSERQPAAEAFATAQPPDAKKPRRVASADVAADDDQATSDVTIARPKSLEKWAKGFRRPVECAVGARDLGKTYGRDYGWDALKACVNRGSFTLLKEVLDVWGEDLRTRPDASLVLAQIIATRGGNVGQDLIMLQEKRVPMFELKAALNSPQTFKGRYLMFVARIGDMQTKKGKVELAVNEMTLQGSTENVLVGRRTGTSASVSASAAGRVGPYSASGSYAASGTRVSGDVETRSTTEFVESGESALVRLKQADPFLSTERNFLFLVRFDGAVVSDADGVEEEGRKTALTTLVAYFDVQTGAI